MTIAPRPMKPTIFSRIRIERPWVRTYPTPRVIAMVPSVVMIGLRFSRVMKKPLKDPINVPRMLADSGVKIALKPESDNVGGHEDFLRKVAELVKSGLDRDVAVKAITIHPAEMLAVDYRLGSLEVGKDANLLILSGDPLDVGTRVCELMIEGRIVYEAP